MVAAKNARVRNLVMVLGDQLDADSAAFAAEVIALINTRFADHPGTLDHFDWPQTAVQAEQALDDFIAHRLPLFGRYQDAIWSGEPWLYHSRLSAAMNLKLLSPRRAGRAPTPERIQAIREVALRSPKRCAPRLAARTGGP